MAALAEVVLGFWAEHAKQRQDGRGRRWGPARPAGSTDSASARQITAALEHHAFGSNGHQYSLFGGCLDPLLLTPSIEGPQHARAVAAKRDLRGRRAERLMKRCGRDLQGAGSFDEPGRGATASHNRASKVARPENPPLEPADEREKRDGRHCNRRRAGRRNACAIPTEAPEGDGSLRWSSTTNQSIVGAHAAGKVELGYTYADIVYRQRLIDEQARRRREGTARQITPQRFVGGNGEGDPQPGQGVRYLDRRCATINPIVWGSVHAHLVELPRCACCGVWPIILHVHPNTYSRLRRVPASYTDERVGGALRRLEQRGGVRRVKMKIGARPRDRDCDNYVRAAREAIGPSSLGLFRQMPMAPTSASRGTRARRELARAGVGGVDRGAGQLGRACGATAAARPCARRS